MKNKLMLSLAGLLLCFSFTQLSSQTTYSVDSSNLTTTVDAIFDLHGNAIDQTYLQVHDYLGNLLAGSSPTSCAPPNPSLQTMNDTDISFSWTLIPGAISYNVGYLKLNQLSIPNNDQFTVYNPNINITIPNGLILIAFQSRCPLGNKGRVEVIIIDKPSFILTRFKDCDCPNTLDSYGSAFDTDFEGYTFPYTHEAEETGIYKGVIQYTTAYPIVYSEFLVTINQEAGALIVRKYDPCLDNMNDDGNVMYSEHPVSGLTLASLYFSDGIRLEPNEQTGSFTFYRCGLTVDHDEEKEASKEVTFQVFPNPAQYAVTLQFPSMVTEQSAMLYLFDAYGREIRSQVVKGTSLTLDIADLNTGMYHAVLETETETLQTKFIKTN